MRIVKANIFHHLTQQVDVRRCFARFHPATNHLAQNAAEVFVTGVLQEKATAVSQHTDKAAQQTELRQLGHLTFHTVFLIVKPPAGTELHFARHTFALKLPMMVPSTSLSRGFRQ